MLASLSVCREMTGGGLCRIELRRGAILGGTPFGDGLDVGVGGLARSFSCFEALAGDREGGVEAATGSSLGGMVLGSMV